MRMESMKDLTGDAEDLHLRYGIWFPLPQIKKTRQVCGFHVHPPPQAWQRIYGAFASWSSVVTPPGANYRKNKL